MAKNKTILLCIFWLVIGLDLSCQNTELTDKVASIYHGEVGVRELTGRNDGERVEEYLRATGLPKGNAWCAAFVTWVFRQAEVTAPISAWSPSWFSRNVIYTRGAKNNITPGKADVFGIYFNNLKRIAHVGFIDEWSDGSVYTKTVEGNTNDTGSREGDGVYYKRRLKSQVYKVSRWTN